MQRKSPARNAYTDVLAILETEFSALPAKKRLRAITKFHSRIDRRLWMLRDHAMREFEKEMASMYRRWAREESDPSQKAELRRIADVLTRTVRPESTLSA